MEERCIHGGRCVLVCPQQAKKVRNNIGKVKELISAGRKVVASLAAFICGGVAFKTGKGGSSPEKVRFHQRPGDVLRR